MKRIYTVREFVEKSAKFFGFDIVWQGAGVEEKGIDKKTSEVLIEIDPKYFRPTEVDILLGDYSKAKNNIGWAPKTSFTELVEGMCEEDIRAEEHKNI